MSTYNLIELIPRGEKNAVHAYDLALRVGLSKRELRKQIELLRRAGAVILSSDKGYYLPADLAEVTAYRKKEEARAKSVFRSLQSARQLEARLSGKT